MFHEMYYQRVISENLKALIMPQGGLNWLYSLVKDRNDLDFLIGANKSKNWIYVYRGTTRLLDISIRKGIVRVSADTKYLKLAEKNGLEIYGIRKMTELDFKDDFNRFLASLSKDIKLDRYFNNKKEGYFQNLFSRQFGILSEGNEDFVVVDKEVVIGYKDKATKEKYFGKQRKRFMAINECLSKLNPKRYGKKLSGKSLGNELDFLAVTRRGEILLVEFKHGSSTKGIYLSPIQIGLYHSLFYEYINQKKSDFINQVSRMIDQKKEIGLISKRWPKVTPSIKIIPVLVIAEYNSRSSAIIKFKEVLKICRDKLNDNTFLSALKIYAYGEDMKLTPLSY